MAIAAHNPAQPRRQRIRSPHLVIIEFVLNELPHMGTTGQLLHLSLAPNYQVDPEKFHHELIIFDVDGGTYGLDEHADRMSKIVGELQKRYAYRILLLFPFGSNMYRNFDYAILIIHTHSDDTCGNLWFTSNHVESHGPAAAPLSEVSIHSTRIQLL